MKKVEVFGFFLGELRQEKRKMVSDDIIFLARYPFNLNILIIIYLRNPYFFIYLIHIQRKLSNTSNESSDMKSTVVNN